LSQAALALSQGIPQLSRSLTCHEWPNRKGGGNERKTTLREECRSVDVIVIVGFGFVNRKTLLETAQNRKKKH